MKRRYIVLILVLLVNASVYADEKASIGAQIGLFYPGIFIDVPASDRSSFRLGVGTLWGTAPLVEAKYRRRFGGRESGYYWEASAMYIGPGKFLFIQTSASTATQISLGTRFSKGEHGAWFASLGILSGAGGTGVYPNIGYEFLP